MARSRIRFTVIATVLAAVGGLVVALALPADAGQPEARFVKTSAWSSGYIGQYTITNKGSKALTSWRLEFDAPAGATVGSYWNAAMSRSGQRYTFTNREYNGTVARDASVQFGFQVAGTGSPSACRLNGRPCAGGPSPATPAPSTPVPSASSSASPSSTPTPGTPPPSTPDGSWHPKHLAVGTVYEPFTGTDAFFKKVRPRFPNGGNVDYGYVYLNGGAQVDEWPERTRRLATKSKEQSITPIFVVYGIGGNSDSHGQVWANLQSAGFLSQYFRGLRDVGRSASGIMGGGRVGYVVEPDTLGYLQQQYASKYGNDPNKMPAATSAVYDAGVLVRGTDPDFPNTLNGLVRAINHVLRKYTTKAFLGWQLNLWAAPGAPGKGIIHATEELGFEAGKARIIENAKANAMFAERAGVTSGGAEFISIDKYGLDGAGAAGADPNDPKSSYWFWNADLWNNYLLFVRTLKETLSRPVVLWQVPAGHINGSTHASPTGYNPSGRFPDLPNAVQRYEDSASTYFFGDTFAATGARRSYFATNEWKDAKVSVSGDRITWGPHVKEAADAGVVAILMGAGVGTSTRGVPQPGAAPADQPTDNYYWISRVQEYYGKPVPLP